MVFARATCAHVTRVCAARVRMSHCVVLMLLVAFVSSFSFPCLAYADDWYSVLYTSQLDASNQYIVSASNRYDAAAFICGKNKSEVDAITLEQRAQLSLRGGSFQELANALDDVWPYWNDESLYSALEGTFGETLMSNMTLAFGANTVYPYVHFNPDALSLYTIDYWQTSCPTKIFACNVDSQLIANATSDLNTILGGGTIGGGYGGLQEEGNYYVFYGDPNWYNGSSLNTSKRYWLWDSTTQAKYTCAYVSLSQQNLAIPSGLRLLLPKSMISSDFLAVYDPLDYTYALQLTQKNNWSDSNLTPTCDVKLYVFTSDNISFDETSNEPYSDSSYLSTVATGSGMYTYKTASGRMAYSYASNTITITSDNVFPHTNTLINYSTSSTSLPKTNTALENMLMVSKSDGSAGGGDDEPNPWPVPDPPVETPDVPEPPVVNPPPITGPVFPTDPPQDPTITPEPEPTGTDYTVYLKAIIRQLNQVMVQMSNHCKHIRDQISTSANAIISNLHTYIEDLQEAIDSNFSALNDYLEDLTKWYEQYTDDIVLDLKEELRTIQNILRQILRKIGVSRGTPREVEKEVDDDFNFLEWLINFITSKLAGVIDEFVGDVGALINGVKDKFPFSIPWDIMGMLALLDGVRATPRFEITLPAVSGWWQQTTFVIDLSPFDSVASAVRIMINAWWLLVLAMKTNWMLMIMGDSTSLGERIANRISGGGE